MNCDGLFHVNFKNLPTTPSPLQKLFAKKITTISLTGTNKGTTTITLSPEQQQLVMEKISCVVTEAKTLIK
jgi:UDP-N-acetylmuramyl tripeptide synthase